jgi:hypothetical protein
MISSIQQDTGVQAYTRLVGASKQTGSVQYPPLDTSDTPAMFKRQEDTIRSGFGDGTVSVPTAAIRTLGSGLESARRVVPSVDQLQYETRADMANERRAMARELQDTQQQNMRQITLAPQKAAEQAQDFINTVNRSAGDALARVSGESVSSGGAAATVRTSGQTLNRFLAQSGSADEQQASPKFNVLV